jgi:hypothetical protein
MIVANVRQQIGRNDAQLALRLVGRDSDADYGRAEAILRDAGIDALLDDPRLLAGLLESRRAMQASYALFTYVVVRHALRRVGVDDRHLADYVASVMLNFGLRDRANRIGDADDQTYDTLAGISTDVETSDPQRSFLARAHLGNYALWFSGIFPDHIAKLHWRRGAPDLEYYETMGRKGFELAASHRLAGQYGMANLYAAAADHFAMMRMALNDISDTLLFPNQSSPDRFMRQVSNESRWRQQ